MINLFNVKMFCYKHSKPIKADIYLLWLSVYIYTPGFGVEHMHVCEFSMNQRNTQTCLEGPYFQPLPVRACSSLTQVPISPSVYFEQPPKLWALQCGVNGPGLFSSHCCTHKHIQQNFLWSSPDRQHQLRLQRSRTVRDRTKSGWDIFQQRS